MSKTIKELLARLKGGEQGQAPPPSKTVPRPEPAGVSPEAAAGGEILRYGIVGLALQGGEAIFGVPDGPSWRYRLTELAREFWEELFSPGREIVLFNAKGLFKHLLERKIKYPKEPYPDLYLGEKVLMAGADLGEPTVESVLSRYLGVRSDNPGNLGAAWLRMEARLQKEGLWETYLLERSLVPVVAKMEVGGVFIDRLYIERRLGSINEAMQKGDIGINPRSQEEVLKAFRDLNVDLGSTSKEVLSALKSEHPLAGMILESRRLLNERTILEGLLRHVNPETGRIHPKYDQLGTVTGRFTCSEPDLHNLPRGDVRHAIVAPPGWKLIIGDYSAAQVAIIAELSGDPVLVRGINGGKDIHRWVASLLLKKAYDAVTAEERQKIKGVFFGWSFGLQKENLKNYMRSAFDIEVSSEEAAAILKELQGTLREVSRWQRVTRNAGYSRQETRTLGGRRRRFDYLAYVIKNAPEALDKVAGLVKRVIKEPGTTTLIFSQEVKGAVETELRKMGLTWREREIQPKATELWNSPVQGTEADIVKTAMLLIDPEIGALGGRIILMNHDEIVVEVPEDAAERATRIVQEKMEEAGQKYLRRVALKAKVVATTSWAGK